MTDASASESMERRASQLYFGALVVVLLLSNLASALYAAEGLPDPRGVSLVCYILVTTIVYFWFKRFAAAHHISLPFDFGWFLYLAWWVIVPYYLFKVRGWKAFRTILPFVAAYLVTYGISLLVYFAIVASTD